MVENQVPHNWLENIVIQVAVKMYRVKNDYDRFSRVAARLHVVLAHHRLHILVHHALATPTLTSASMSLIIQTSAMLISSSTIGTTCRHRTRTAMAISRSSTSARRPAATVGVDRLFARWGRCGGRHRPGCRGAAGPERRNAAGVAGQMRKRARCQSSSGRALARQARSPTWARLSRQLRLPRR